MRGSLLLVASVVLVVGFAPAPFAKKERRGGEDLTDVKGKWELVSFEADGKRSLEAEQKYRVEMTAERFALVTNVGQRREEEFVMRLHPAAQPPAFTWAVKGRGPAQEMFVGSYRLQKGEMTMVFREGTKLADRPTDFTGGRATWRLVMRRVSRN